MALLAALAVVTIAAGTVVLAVVERVAARGVAIDMVGAVAAVGAIALLALAASDARLTRVREAKPTL